MTSIRTLVGVAAFIGLCMWPASDGVSLMRTSLRISK